MYEATTTSRAANQRRRVEARVRPATWCPATAPATAAMVNGRATCQSKPAVASLAVNATAQLTAMTKRELPTAVGMSNPKASTRAGTMMKPPPTPKKPVMNPTTVPAATTLTTIDSQGPARCFLGFAAIAAEWSSTDAASTWTVRVCNRCEQTGRGNGGGG